MSCEDLITQNIQPKALPIVMVSAAVLLDRDGKVFIAQRPKGKAMAGLWEFPGGKLEAGERPDEALIRELREELGIETASSCLAPLTFVSHAYDHMHLIMFVYVCRTWKGFLKPQEHQKTAWVEAKALYDYPMPAADLPLIPHLLDLLMPA
jgi:8-oxo-dGTP diphosphatase